MCTIIAAVGIVRAAPLVVAANRDEFYARPTEGGQLLGERPRIIGGRDVQKGGTWMGLNEHGLFVGLTNLGPGRPGRRSRGELVMRALARRTVDEVDALLEAEAAGSDYSPFNLLYGTVDALHTAHAPDDALHIEAHGPGLHVVPSGAEPGDRLVPRVPRIEGLWRQRVVEQGLAEVTDREGEAQLVETLLGILSDAERPTDDTLEPLVGAHPDRALNPYLRELQAISVHTPAYGTRSSTVAMIGDQRYRYLYLDREPGAPAAADVLVDLAPLLTAPDSTHPTSAR